MCLRVSLRFEIELGGRFDSVSGQSVDLQVKDSDTAKREIAQRQQAKRELNEINKQKNLEKRRKREEEKKAKRSAKERRYKRDTQQAPAPFAEKREEKKSEPERRMTREATKRGEEIFS